MNKITEAVEKAGWNWLVRSNKFPTDVPTPYFANITYDNPPSSNWKSYPAYGWTAEEALQNAFDLWKKRVG